MVHGDLDLSTPIENAEEQLQSLPNGHLVRIHGGTHGAFGEISRHDKSFMGLVEMFLNADLETEAAKKEREKQEEEHKGLLEAIQKQLDDHVSDPGLPEDS